MPATVINVPLFGMACVTPLNTLIPGVGRESTNRVKIFSIHLLQQACAFST